MNSSTPRQGAALNPSTHYILTPIFLVSFGYAIYLTAHSRHENPVLYPWLIVLFFALILLNMQSRLYALRLQDRIIRLEEHLRLASLLPAAEQASLRSLTTPQLIGLRFASDAELPSLATRAATEGLSTAAIKEAITSWRRDDARV
ncbi:MAG: DUF6526 family protein [Janthinobacterium lividum]